MIITIPLKLPSLNEYIAVCRTNKFQAGKFKADTEYGIMLFLKRITPLEKPVTINFHWVEANARRDLDNIAFAKKFILDALVKLGKLKDDGQKYVRGFTDTFEVGKEYKVILNIEEVNDDHGRNEERVERDSGQKKQIQAGH